MVISTHLTNMTIKEALAVTTPASWSDKYRYFTEGTTFFAAELINNKVTLIKVHSINSINIVSGNVTYDDHRHVQFEYCESTKDLAVVNLLHRLKHETTREEVLKARNKMLDEFQAGIDAKEAAIGKILDLDARTIETLTVL